MLEHERRIRPALAAVVLICFFMPFLKVTCGGQQIMSVTGFDLATGKEVKQADPFANFKESQAYRPDPNSPMAPPESLWQNDPSNPLNQMEGLGQLESATNDVQAQPTATVAMFLAVVALVASLGVSRRGKTVSAISAGVCAISLFVLKSNAGGDIPPEAAAVIAVEWTTSFWVALIGSLAVAGYTFHVLTQDTEPTPAKPRLVIGSYQDKPPTEKVVS